MNMITVSLPSDPSCFRPPSHTPAARMALRPGARARLDGDLRVRQVPVVPSTVATDCDLFRRIAAREEGALAELYDRHSRMAYSVIMRILRRPSDAEDVLQETFVRVWSRAETYDARLGSPAAWLTRIARNRAIDRLRAQRVRGDISVEQGRGADGQARRVAEPETRETPEVLLQENATTGALRAAMAALPVAQRELIEAAFFEGYTHQELATRFAVPLGTVKTRIRTGLTAMRERLEQVV
jgi:RNA polymerase sigma-70 factor, ECF subfamily